MSEKLHTGKERTDEEGQAGSAGSPPSCGPSCECNTEKRLSNRTKAIISLVIVLAAGAVLTNTIVRKTNTSANDNNQAFSTVTPQQNREIVSLVNTTKDKTSENSPKGTTPLKTTSEPDKERGAIPKSETVGPSQKTNSRPKNVEGKTSKPPAAKSSLWKEPLNSLSSLNTVAASNAAVFVLLSERDIEGSASEVSKIDAAAKTIKSRGVNIAAFSLKKDAPEFSNLAKQLSGSGVLVMVKGRGMSGVPGGELTEEKLIQAYVTASQPRSGCGPVCGPSDCK